MRTINVDALLTSLERRLVGESLLESEAFEKFAASEEPLPRRKFHRGLRDHLDDAGNRGRRCAYRPRPIKHSVFVLWRSWG